jgi:hypothetical protein
MNNFTLGVLCGALLVICVGGFAIWTTSDPFEAISCDSLEMLTSQKIQPIKNKDGCEIFVADKYWIPFDQWLKEMQ